MILQGESADAILETIKSFGEADRESRRYLRKHVSHFVGYVGSRSGSADGGDNTDSVLEAIGTNTDVPASSDESMTSADFRKFSTEYNSKAVDEEKAMDEGSGENSPKAQDDMEIRDNPEVQMSESTDQRLILGNGPKAVFATGAAKKAKKKNKTLTKDLPPEEVIAEEYEEDSDGALIPDEPKKEASVDGHVITEGARKLIDAALTTPIPTAAELTADELDKRAHALEARRRQLLDEEKNLEEEKKRMAAAEKYNSR